MKLATNTVDHTNKRYGRLTAIERHPERDKWGNVRWFCECDCGGSGVYNGRHLTRGYAKSCGCLYKYNYQGKRFGKLTVLKELPDRDKYKRVMWLCRCDCGNERDVPTGDLTGGTGKSCGCLRPTPNMTVCDFCGNDIQRKPSCVYDKNFCNRKCQALWQSENKHGENHPNWQGGIGQLPYCPVWGKKEFKEMVKIRDGYKCQNPDCWGTDNLLCVHHVDYEKMNCVPGNLITVCRSCNSRANTDRDWHTSYYQAILYKRGVAVCA